MHKLVILFAISLFGTIACTPKAEKYDKYVPDVFDPRPFGGMKENVYCVIEKTSSGDIIGNDTIESQDVPLYQEVFYDILGRIDSTTYDGDRTFKFFYKKNKVIKEIERHLSSENVYGTIYKWKDNNTCEVKTRNYNYDSQYTLSHTSVMDYNNNSETIYMNDGVYIVYFYKDGLLIETQNPEKKKYSNSDTLRLTTKLENIYENGLLTKSIHYYNGKHSLYPNKVVTNTYYTKFDKQGNWIEKYEEEEDNKALSREIKTITREIIYRK